MPFSLDSENCLFHFCPYPVEVLYPFFYQHCQLPCLPLRFLTQLANPKPSWNLLSAFCCLLLAVWPEICDYRIKCLLRLPDSLQLSLVSSLSHSPRWLLNTLSLPLSPSSHMKSSEENSLTVPHLHIFTVFFALENQVSGSCQNYSVHALESRNLFLHLSYLFSLHCNLSLSAIYLQIYKHALESLVFKQTEKANKYLFLLLHIFQLLFHFFSSF